MTENEWDELTSTRATLRDLVYAVEHLLPLVKWEIDVLQESAGPHDYESVSKETCYHCQVTMRAVVLSERIKKIEHIISRC